MRTPPTTSQFIKASPQMKPIMILDSYNYLAEQFERIQKEMKVLTAWVDVTPSLIEVGKSHVINAPKLAEAQKHFVATRDALTTQFVAHDERLSAFAKYLETKQFV